MICPNCEKKISEKEGGVIVSYADTGRIRLHSHCRTPFANERFEKRKIKSVTPKN